MVSADSVIQLYEIVVLDHCFQFIQAVANLLQFGQVFVMHLLTYCG